MVPVSVTMDIARNIQGTKFLKIRYMKVLVKTKLTVHYLKSQELIS